MYVLPEIAKNLRRASVWTLLATVVTTGPAAVAPLAAAAERAAREPAAAPPAVVLITLDTTRADRLGCYGGPARTPALDGLAARGSRWSQALTPSPLTLPAHVSLLTGLEPPEHGVRDNGVAVLGAGVPTLASVLAGRGWDTAAFVASRVLDRRFGLDRGFGVYDDKMAAEALGQYGYPERDARAVTDAALAWLAGREPARGTAGAGGAPARASKPFFLWVHYYDPHAPYQPPGAAPGASDEARYGGEIEYVDAQVARLLAALPAGSLIAAVGDHGEGLGEHGERGHGIFLYQASLHVPLIVAGAGVPAGRAVPGTVSSRRLAPTLLRLLGIAPPPSMAPALPGLPGLGAPAPGEPVFSEPVFSEPVFSETVMPRSSYAWSPLEALTDGDWRLIVAPRPELYDLAGDPGETANRLDDQRPVARRLRDALAARREGFARHEAPAAEADPELEAALRSLGYATGGRAGDDRGDGIDPKEGIALLTEFEAAKKLVAAGRAAEAVTALEKLVERNPRNVPFWTQLGAARLAAGRNEAALEAYRRAASLNPGLDFLHLNLARVYGQIGRPDDARREYELALEINPRAADAWFNLAEMAAARGAAEEERRLLAEAVAAGTSSVRVLARLGQLEMEAGRPDAAEEHLAEATRLTPEWAMAWLLRAQLRLRSGETEAARPFLERAAALDPGGTAGAQARRWLAEIGPGARR